MGPRLRSPAAAALLCLAAALSAAGEAQPPRKDDPSVAAKDAEREMDSLEVRVARLAAARRKLAEREVELRKLVERKQFLEREIVRIQKWRKQVAGGTRAGKYYDEEIVRYPKELEDIEKGHLPPCRRRHDDQKRVVDREEAEVAEQMEKVRALGPPAWPAIDARLDRPKPDPDLLPFLQKLREERPPPPE